jgi:hypothetical protein
MGLRRRPRNFGGDEELKKGERESEREREREEKERERERERERAEPSRKPELVTISHQWQSDGGCRCNQRKCTEEIWRCVWLDIRTKAVAIKKMRSKRPMSFIIIGYLLTIRVLAVFALSLGTTSQLQEFGTGMCTGSMVESHNGFGVSASLWLVLSAP